MSSTPFPQLVYAEVKLLNEGLPLQAFDDFFDSKIMMYANDELFASDAIEARAKQEPYINAAQSIAGKITDVTLDETAQLCAFRNVSTFVDQQGNSHQIDGLSWQKWRNSKIVEERYYDGEHMHSLLEGGILNDLNSHKV